MGARSLGGAWKGACWFAWGLTQGKLLINYAFFDFVLFSGVSALTFLVTAPGLMTLYNMKVDTNAYEKLKGIKKNRKPHSWHELAVFIYGADYSLSKILFAAYYDEP